MNVRPPTFAPCAACARHVRTDDAACPFCGASCPERAAAPSRFPRVSRAALFAAGASLALAGCDDAFIATAHADSHEAISMVPQYGAPSDYERPPRPVAPPATAPDAGSPAQPDAGAPPPAARLRRPS
jgi:hypothetical protein